MRAGAVAGHGAAFRRAAGPAGALQAGLDEVDEDVVAQALGVVKKALPRLRRVICSTKCRR